MSAAEAFEAGRPTRAAAAGADVRIARWGQDRYAGTPTRIGAPFRCPLLHGGPEVRRHEGQAQIRQHGPVGEWRLVCGCDGEEEAVPLAGLWGAEARHGGRATRGAVFTGTGPFERLLWRWRLEHETGVRRVRLPVIEGADEMAAGMRRVLDGLVLLVALCSDRHDSPASAGHEPYSARFAAAWADTSRMGASRALRGLVALGVLRRGPNLEPENGGRATHTYALPARAPVLLDDRRRTTIERVETPGPRSSAPYVVPLPPWEQGGVLRCPTGTPGPARRGRRQREVQELKARVCDVKSHDRAWRSPDGSWWCVDCDPLSSIEFGIARPGGST